MDLLGKIEEYLDSVYETHMYFMFDPSELSAYYSVPKLINDTFGHDFWDIIIGYESYQFILAGLDNITDRTRRQKAIVHRLCDIILQKVGIEVKDYLDAHELESYIVNLCQEAGAVSFRVHVMLNEVVDIDLQMAINDLMLNSGLTFFCYSTHTPLTLSTLDNEELRFPLDYDAECSELFNYNNKDDFERKMKKYD